MYKIILENLKNIKRLEYIMPNKKGVYLLTGTNGVGKSTLLTAMARIGIDKAFANNIKSSTNDKKIDDYNEASITYINSEKNLKVKYIKKAHRWTPTPKKMNVKNIITFSEVVYINADHSRIVSSVKELSGKSIKKADEEMIRALMTILDNEQFMYLHSTPENKGRYSNKAGLIKFKGKFYSDKNFSTGEIVLYNLIKKLSNIKENSLILIDEVDLSLNSKTQINLLKYLEEVAEKKKAIMILSTHSPVIIKSVEKKKIYYLEEKVRGKIECINPCYPSYALNGFTSIFETNIDYIFVVEDAEAKLLLDEMVSKFFVSQSRIDKPKYRTLTIGGYPQVLDFLHLNKSFIPDIKMYAFFDLDVEEEIRKKSNSDVKGDIELIQKYIQSKRNLTMLPITPELGIIENIIENRNVYKDFLGGFDNCHTERNLHTVQSVDYKNYDTIENVRTGSKKKVELVIKGISQDTGVDQLAIRRSFYKYYVDNVLDIKVLKRIIGTALS